MTNQETIIPSETQTPDLNDPALYINRELSWLTFNERCLGEALNPDLPLLERVRFLSIFSNNLDEFYMVRVSGLKDQVTAGVVETPPDGLSPQEQLSAIRERVLPMLHEQRRVFHEDILPKLAEHGVTFLTGNGCTAPQRAAVRRYFQVEVYPVLTPLAVDPGRPFPHISNLSLNLAILLEDEEGNERFARVKVPSGLSRIVPMNEVLRLYDTEGGNKSQDLRTHTFMWLEDVIEANLDLLFPGMKVTATGAFRITRNSDMEITEEEASDLLETIEESVRQRRFGQVVRMSVVDSMPQRMLAILLKNLEIQEDDVISLRAPLGMSDLAPLASTDMPLLKLPPYLPQRPAAIPQGENLFSAIRRQDILLHRPYDSFLPVIEFFQQAAEDPQVLAIKATLYRTGQNSPIVEALLQAQENAKQVAVLVELKARFDEENNIGWARQLEGSGVHVVYGLLGLKTHAKVALVVRKEGDKMRRYVHLSTGNYNASTARGYTDLCLFTCRDDIASDVSELFNRLTGYASHNAYRKLLVAPEYLREQVVALIQREIDHAQAGRKAHLIFKMNSVVDAEMIRMLYRASMAGVRVDLLVRGICCLRPGIPGISENIRVTCLIGRYLEHARVFYFRNDGNFEVYLGSADLMPRNLNSRVEALYPVESEPLKHRIVDEILAIEMADNVKARELLPDGSYRYLHPEAGQEAIDSQKWFMEHSKEH